MSIIIINSAGPVAYLLCISLFSTQYIISWFSVLCIHIISAYESKFQHQHGLLFSTPTESAIKNFIYLVFWHINMTSFNNFSMEVPHTAMVKTCWTQNFGKTLVAGRKYQGLLCFITIQRGEGRKFLIEINRTARGCYRPWQPKTSLPPMPIKSPEYLASFCNTNFC